MMLKLLAFRREQKLEVDAPPVVLLVVVALAIIISFVQYSARSEEEDKEDYYISLRCSFFKPLY